MNSKEQAQQLMDQLEKIIQYAQEGYNKCGVHYEYTGKNESWVFYKEYVKKCYEPLVEQNKEICFLDRFDYEKCKGNIFFDGKFVKIKKVEEKYFIYPLSLWLLSGCFEKARKENPVLFGV